MARRSDSDVFADIFAAMATHEATPTLEDLVADLRELGAESVWLYGSVAAGRSRSDSDVDLFVVAPESARREIDRRFALARPVVRVGVHEKRHGAHVITASVAQTNDPDLFRRMQPEAQRLGNTRLGE